MNNLEDLENILQYKFKDIRLLKTALCHTSYAHENFGKIESYERLEFLGDTVLNLAISERIYMNNTKINEGNMSKIRATVICEDTLYEAALKLNYDKFILLGNGEEKLGGRNKPSILSDVFEAVLAAIYLDSNFNIVRDFINRVLGKVADEAVLKLGEKDHKTKLQEVLQGKTSEKISYEIIKESGPAHKREYVSIVKLGNKILGQGNGTSKKEAEQNAADEALKNI